MAEGEPRTGSGLSAAFTNRSGVVATFDDHVGAGTVRDTTTDEVWPFHCTRIVGGGRTVPTGALVDFRVDLGPTGLEAVAVAVRSEP
jgi:cold shock CspA family protein